MYKRLLLISPFLFIMNTVAAQRAEDFVTIAEDGAWCWFSDPRAIYYKGIHERTYTGFVTSGGDIMVASRDHRTGDEAKTLIYPRLQSDDHVNPSLLILPDDADGFSSPGTAVRFIIPPSGEPEEITSFAAVDSSIWGKMARYTNPVLLKKENNRIYLFFRGGYD
ncbi:MAG: BNR-4 repeat-containing protein [Bacteroidales bacterium]